jgi:hypothetical protein
MLRGCAAYGRAFLIYDFSMPFECPVCLRTGKVEAERGFRHSGEPIFSEARVEFDYDPVLGIYRQVARAREGRLLGQHNIYTLQSPLVANEERARQVARAILRSLNVSLELPVFEAERPASRAQLMEEGWPILV